MSFDKTAYQREYMKKKRNGTLVKKLDSNIAELESNKEEIKRLKIELESNILVVEELKRLVESNKLESNKEDTNSIERECLFKGDKCYINMPKTWAGKKVRITNL